jgi:hypothetical protein
MPLELVCTEPPVILSPENQALDCCLECFDIESEDVELCPLCECCDVCCECDCWEELSPEWKEMVRERQLANGGSNDYVGLAMRMLSPLMNFAEQLTEQQRRNLFDELRNQLIP